jgi:hypothetical protein
MSYFRPYFRNPKLHPPGKRGYVRAGRKNIKNAWKAVADENLLVIGPFPPIFHAPGTHILYLLKDPADMKIFNNMLRGKTEECMKCSWNKNGPTPCCEASRLEVEWYDQGGTYIGPSRYDPDTGYDDPPECECECECLRIPVFQMRRMIGGPGTLEMFWDMAASKLLAGAVQFIVEDKDLVITHMVVDNPYQRNRINSFMIDQVQKEYPERNLLFHDLTDKGRSFMEGYGGAEYGA